MPGNRAAMATDEDASFWPTERLLLKKGRKHYRTVIAPMHWQLRSLISAERRDIVYFPSGTNNTHITRLNTSTRECECIKVITFHPRCLVAKNGWICCGGEHGEFAIVRDLGRSDTSDDNDTLARNSQLELSALDSYTQSQPSYAQLHRDMLNIVEQFNSTTKTWTASNHKFGLERINCITIWQPPKPSSGFSKPGRYQSPVAVLSNNDKSVTVVGLHDCDQLDHLEYPDCVNRAVISPDGTMMAAICDDPFLYVHVRQATNKSRVDESFEWVSLPKIKLKGQWHTDTSDCRGSFAATFSPSGKYLAVGTQYGTISIFSTAGLVDPEQNPLVTWFNSARAPNDNGAVRDMAFSPGPHDLLAWTEHRGRIGVADARTNFTRRQIIAFDSLEDIEHFNLNDRTTIDPRLLDPRSDRDGGDSPGLPSLLNQRSSSRPPPPAAGSESSGSGTTRWNQPFTADPTAVRYNRPFSQEEMSVLQAVQAEQHRRQRRNLNAPPEREHQDTQSSRSGALPRPSMWAERRETLTRILERERQRESRDHQHRSTTTQTTASMAEQERERRAPTPRRRGSILLALSQNQDTTTSQEASRQPDSGTTTEGAGEGGRDSPTPWLTQRLASGWADLDALYTLANSDSGPNQQTRVDISQLGWAGRPAATSGPGDAWNAESTAFRAGFRRYGRYGHSREHPQFPDDTAGLSWSDDGQILYIGTEDGIYEFQVDMQARKVFPDIMLR